MSFNDISALKELIFLLKKIPFVSSRHLYRFTEHFLSIDKDELKIFFNKLESIKNKLIICEKCSCWKETDLECFWCGNNREKGIICIVETWIEAISIERSGMFKGEYHVLGGSISLINGITPDKLSFNLLINRIMNDDIQELVIAINQTPEGNATAAYIENVINQKKLLVKITYLATGVPVGVNLEFVDKLTLSKAFSQRR